jgi:DNA-binding response OmpR family regulator
MKILIAEDHQPIREGLQELLQTAGYECLAASNGGEAWVLFQRHAPEFCLLDVMMPEMDGLELCRQIRRVNERVPIVFLTAKGAELDRVLGLELGADDYILKPFSPREVLVRIKRIAFRCEPVAPLANTVFRLHDLVVDVAALQARRGEQVIALTEREAIILRTLYLHPTQVVSRDTLLNEGWGHDYFNSSRALDQCISVLRKKIERNSHGYSIILTVYGVGYRLG